MPTTFSIRIAIATIRLIALFVVPAYSAAILTSILLDNVKLPFSDIRGFVEDGSYQLGFSIEDRFHVWFNVRHHM